MRANAWVAALVVGVVALVMLTYQRINGAAVTGGAPAPTQAARLVQGAPTAGGQAVPLSGFPDLDALAKQVPVRLNSYRIVPTLPMIQPSMPPNRPVPEAPAKAGQVWAVCNVTATNNLSDRLPLNSTDFQVVGSDGLVYGPEIVSRVAATGNVDYFSATLTKGASATGETVIPLPQGVRPSSAELRTR